MISPFKKEIFKDLVWKLYNSEKYHFVNQLLNSYVTMERELELLELQNLKEINSNWMDILEKGMKYVAEDYH